MRDDDGESKGFGFVQFETDEEADNAIKDINEKSSTVEKVNVHQTTSSNQPVDTSGSRESTDVFIGNIDDRLDEEQLHELLSTYGIILTLQV